MGNDEELERLRPRLELLEAENARLRSHQALSELGASTDNPLAEAALRDEQASVSVGLFLYYPQTDVLFMSPALTELLGVEDLRGARLDDLLHVLSTDDRREAKRRLAAAFRQRRHGSLDFRIEPPGGGLRYVTAGTSSLDIGGVPVVIGAMLDRTESVLLRERLERTVVQLSELVRLSGAATTKVSASGEVEWSPELRRLLEVADDVAPSLEAILARVHPEDLPVVARAIEAQSEGAASNETIRFRLVTASKTRHIVAGIRPVGGPGQAFVGTFLDVTEHCELSAQLERAHRLEPLARFATGLAHDVNNRLTVIAAAAAMLKQDYPAATDVDMILDACQSASTITRELLNYARAESSSPHPVALNAALGPIVELGRRMLHDSMSVTVSLEKDLPTVSLDPVQLQQMVLNLLSNARDASDDHGTIQIRTDRSRGDPPHDERLGAEVVIVDDGAGMDAETLRRCREPFFSTKSAERSTGLGLAMCESLMQQVGGRLDVFSAPGAGTTVRLWWPAHDGDAVEERTPARTPQASFSIVLVDDDPQVRRAIQRLLEAQGHRVRAAASPSAALALTWGEQDLLVTDRVMPQMSGVELIERLRAERVPALKAVMMSAYGPGDVDLGDVRYVAKPFSVQQLISALQELVAADG